MTIFTKSLVVQHPDYQQKSQVVGHSTDFIGEVCETDCCLKSVLWSTTWPKLSQVLYVEILGLWKQSIHVLIVYISTFYHDYLNIWQEILFCLDYIVAAIYYHGPTMTVFIYIPDRSAVEVQYILHIHFRLCSVYFKYTATRRKYYLLAVNLQYILHTTASILHFGLGIILFSIWETVSNHVCFCWVVTVRRTHTHRREV